MMLSSAVEGGKKDMSDSIWFSPPDLKKINSMIENTIDTTLGIEITEIGGDFIRGTMPADSRTFQAFGRIHGGANVVLAESLGSLGANLTLDQDKFFAVGQEVNANHLRGVTEGFVMGTAKNIFTGRTSQVWEIRIEDSSGKLSAISRLTMAVVKL